MVKKLLILLVLFVLFSLSALGAQEDCVYYFHSSDCEECVTTSTFMVNLEEKYEQINIHKLDVYYNISNYKLLQTFAVNNQIGKQSIPIAIIGQSYLQGNSSIIQFLEGRILENSNPDCPNPNNFEVVGISGSGMTSANVFDTFSFGITTSDALQNAFHTGIMAVLLFLVYLLSNIREKDKIITRGALYICAVFIIYLMQNGTILSHFAISNFVLFSTKLIGFWGIVIGTIKVKRFFGPKSILLKSISAYTSKYTLKLKQYVITPVGFFVSGLIIAIISIQTSSHLSMRFANLAKVSGFGALMFPTIAYYTILLMSPLIALTLCLYFLKKKSHRHAKAKGQNKESKIKVWKEHHHNVLQFVAGVVMFLAGLLVFFG